MHALSNEASNSTATRQPTFCQTIFEGITFDRTVLPEVKTSVGTMVTCNSDAASVKTSRLIVTNVIDGYFSLISLKIGATSLK